MHYGQLTHRFGSTRGFETLVGGNRVTLLHDGHQALPAMLEAVQKATQEILLEMYWFGSDKTGRRFADALAERARAGVVVRVIYDAVGSFDSSRSMFDMLRSAGCALFEFNPIAPWRRHYRISLINQRDHRKILVVDRKVGFAGGVNLGDPWAPIEEGGGGWRDDMVRIEGPAVEQMHRLFAYTWARSEEHHDSERNSMPPGVLDESPPTDGGVRVLANHFLGERRAIRHAYLERINNAQSHIYIANSYFIPGGKILRALMNAAKRGVDVRVMVPGRNDVQAVLYAGRHLYRKLLDSGVSIYEWQGPMLHAKTVVVDGDWCTIGSYNLDERSWRYNLEITVTIKDESVANAMRERFIEDLGGSEAIVADRWKQRGWFSRVAEWMFYRFRRFL